MYIRAWRRKLTAKETSRYFTDRVASQKPTAKEKASTTTINTGTQSISRRNGIRKINKVIKKTMNEALKSNKPEKAPEMGMIMRGKYTLEIRFMLSIRLREARVTAFAKKPQGSNPASENNG
jgi:hypothetical protein